MRRWARWEDLKGLGLGDNTQLALLSGNAFAKLLREAFDGMLDAAAMETLWAATRGNPSGDFFSPPEGEPRSVSSMVAHRPART